MDRAPYDTTLLCLQPDRVESFALDVGAEFLSRTTTIGLWFWETTVFPPQFRGALRLLDRLWVTSGHVHGVLASVSDVPVQTILLPATMPSVPTVGRLELGIPAGFVFLVVFDFVSAERKNPRAALEAYLRAFAPDDGTALYVKCINGRERKPRFLDELRRMAAGRNDIKIADGYVSPREQDALFACCDCLVSLHRAEGFGFPMLEAMTFGKPVVATAFSGNLDFMDEESSYLVPYRMVAVPERVWGYAPGAEWADPDIGAAAAVMRRVYESHAEARARGGVGRRRVLSEYSLDRAAARVHDELVDARSARTSAATRRKSSVVEAASALARRRSLAHGRERGLRGLYRRTLAGALWPQLEAQRAFDEAVFDSLAGLDRALAAIERRIDAEAGPT